MNNDQMCNCVSTTPINPDFGKVGDVVLANSSFKFYLEPMSPQETEEWKKTCHICKKPRKMDDSQ